ncbi:MAG: ATP-grasp domain-containing protein [Candidatus Lokiarchaeota archaeon]
MHLFKITGKNYAYSRKLLLKQYNDILEENKVFRNYLPLVQEFISGKIYDTVVLAEKGEILTYFQNIRLRTYPKEGGAYTFAEGIKKNSKMLNYARILIKEIGWTGPAMIEFMKSDDDNKFYLMEINGRYWGSIPLTVKSGIDVPWLHYLQLRKSLKNIKNHHYNIIKLRWLIPGEILWLFDNLKAGNFKSIIAFLHSFSNSKYAILSIKDPKPFLGNFLYFLVLLKEILIGSRNIMGERT